MFKTLISLILIPIGVTVLLFLVVLNDSKKSNQIPKPIEKPVFNNTPVKHKIALLADSHTSYENLQKAVDMAKDQNVEAIVHFGDFTDFAEESGFVKSKQILDNSKIEYFVIAGDRDEVEDGVVFDKYFNGKECKANLLQKYGILCLHNSFNYTPLSESYLNEFISNLPGAKIVFAAQPLYNPESIVYMGYYDKNVKQQADNLLQSINGSGVNVVVSGDAHFFSKTNDTNTGLTHYTLGALTSGRNLQEPNFAILYIYEDGEVGVNQIYLQ